MQTRSRDAEDPECDPAGAIFDETLEGLAQIDSQALRFAGTSNLSAVRWLLAMGANAKARDRNGTTLLHAACRCGSYPVVQELVRQALPLDAADSSGWTALHIAAVMGRRDITLLLLRVRANVAVKNKRGARPVTVCSDPGTKEVLESFGAEGHAAAPQPGPSVADVLLGGKYQPDTMTTCEPFFVPRVPLFHDEAHRAEMVRVGIELFSQSVGHSLAFLVAAGAVHDHPSDLSAFLIEHGASPTQLGRFLSEDFSLAQTLRLAFIYLADFAGTGVVGAIVKAFRHLRPPPDLVKLDRLTSSIAHLWWRNHDSDDWDEELEVIQDEEGLDWSTLTEDDIGWNQGEVLQPRGEVTGLRLRRLISSAEGLRRLMFSTVMLYWNLHGAPKHRALPGFVSPRKLSFGSWLAMNAGIEADGSNMPMQVQRGVYQLISQGGLHELLPSVDCEAAVLGEPTPSASSTASGWASVPRGGLERYQPALFSGGGPHLSHRVLSETSGAVLRPARNDAEGDAEAVWLSLHFSLLLFLSSSPSAVPYAFIRLEDAVIRDTNRQNRHLVLAGRPKATDVPGPDKGPQCGGLPRIPFGDSARMPLPLCFLLADGRFQPFEALWLELQFSTEEDLDLWTRHLEPSCCKQRGDTGSADSEASCPVQAG